jgi:hypothetical protein
LLGRLDENNEERIEVRLLTEPSFVEEFDTIVDEITDRHVRGELKADERDYFLKAKERQVKARFASTLIEHAEETRGKKAAPVKTPSLLERLIALFSPQGMMFKFATTAAVVVLVAGIAFVTLRRPSSPQTFATIELSVSDADRAEGPQSKTLKIEPGTDAVKLILNLPEQSSQYKNYQVELSTREGVKTPLQVTAQDARTVTAIAPADLFERGRYGVKLTGVSADGRVEPIRGTYYLMVE